MTGTLSGGYYDYTDKWAQQASSTRGVQRTETTLNEVVDTSRGFVFMTDPNRDFYNEQPQAAVWPTPPDYALRYPISLQSNWLFVQSNHDTPIVNGKVYTQQETDFFAPILDVNNEGSGNIIVGFLIEDEALKTTIRTMLVGLTGAAKCTTPGDYTTAKPWRLSCCVRSGPNDIDDAQIKSWNEVDNGNATPD